MAKIIILRKGINEQIHDFILNTNVQICFFKVMKKKDQKSLEILTIMTL
jgi:hypothetical protein